MCAPNANKQDPKCGCISNANLVSSDIILDLSKPVQGIIRCTTQSLPLASICKRFLGTQSHQGFQLPKITNSYITQCQQETKLLMQT